MEKYITNNNVEIDVITYLNVSINIGSNFLLTHFPPDPIVNCVNTASNNKKTEKISRGKKSKE